jgi:hypothetical protein
MFSFPKYTTIPSNASKSGQSAWRQLWTTWALLLFTLVWIAGTAFFAYNSTLVNPFSTGLFLSNPSNTVAALNVLSHIAVLLLQSVTASLFEKIRWALAGRPRGISAFGFLTLSPATSPIAVIRLMCNIAGRGTGFIAMYQLWGFQRYNLKGFG